MVSRTPQSHQSHASPISKRVPPPKHVGSSSSPNSARASLSLIFPLPSSPSQSVPMIPEKASATGCTEHAMHRERRRQGRTHGGARRRRNTAITGNERSHHPLEKPPWQTWALGFGSLQILTCLLKGGLSIRHLLRDSFGSRRPPQPSAGSDGNPHPPGGPRPNGRPRHGAASSADTRLLHSAGGAQRRAQHGAQWPTIVRRPRPRGRRSAECTAGSQCTSCAC